MQECVLNGKESRTLVKVSEKNEVMIQICLRMDCHIGFSCIDGRRFHIENIEVKDDSHPEYLLCACVNVRRKRCLPELSVLGCLPAYTKSWKQLLCCRSLLQLGQA